MAARRFWRRIDLRWVNVVLYGLIVLSTVVWWDDLRWAADELPRYLRGSVGSPVERRLYLRAKKLIESDRDLDRARALLEQSISIDPNSDAVYWLGEYYLAKGEPDRALEQFERYLAFDPTRLDAYLEAADILRSQERWDEARIWLDRGSMRFRTLVEQFVPRLDPEVGMDYNNKALAVHGYFEHAATRLEQELRLLERQEGSSGRPADAGTD